MVFHHSPMIGADTEFSWTPWARPWSHQEAPDILSHCAVRARNFGVLLCTCASLKNVALYGSQWLNVGKIWELFGKKNLGINNQHDIMWLHAGFFESNESNYVGWCCQACSLDDTLLWSKMVMAPEHPFFSTSLMAIHKHFPVIYIYITWLVLWNIWIIFPIILGSCHHSNWWTPSFFRGVGGSTTNQIDKHR